MPAPASLTRAPRSYALALVWVLITGCGGGGTPALALGQEAVVEHTQLSGATPGPKTTLGITVLAVRTGTIAELEAAGFQLDPDEKAMTPTYVDVRYENKGTQVVDRSLGVSLEDQDGKLISPVVVFDFGAPPYAMCPDRTEGELAPGERFESCSLFLVGQGRTPTKVSFLPYDPQKETEFVYWAIR